jgi:DNA-binding MarR family transcriptional regulator
MLASQIITSGGIRTEQVDLRVTATSLRVGIGAFKRRAQLISAADDLTVPQLTALSRLDRAGFTSASELARQEQITPQAMGVTIARLEELGLVSRRPDDSDGRRSVLSLTAAGRDAITSGRSLIVDKIIATLATSFSPEQVVTLAAAAPLIERLAELL